LDIRLLSPILCTIPFPYTTLFRSVQIAWRLMNSAHFAPYIKEFFNMTPDVIASESATADFVRDNCGTIYHPVGTAKMGPDSDKVDRKSTRLNSSHDQISYADFCSK